MKICTYDGLTMAVLTRNEHCPPHAHTGTDKWGARFVFSFWRDQVHLWDVIPVQNRPSARQLEGLRHTLMLPTNLRRAREIWWNSVQSVCLANQHWDADAGEVVGKAGPHTKVIKAASFNARANKTMLLFGGQSSPQEIAL